MDQKTGIRSLYDEFFRGYGAEIRLFCPDFRPNSTYKPTSASGRGRRIAKSTTAPPAAAPVLTHGCVILRELAEQANDERTNQVCKAPKADQAGTADGE